VQQEKTLSKDSLVKYLDGGFNVDAIVHQARSFCLSLCAAGVL